MLNRTTSYEDWTTTAEDYAMVMAILNWGADWLLQRLFG